MHACLYSGASSCVVERVPPTYFCKHAVRRCCFPSHDNNTRHAAWMAAGLQPPKRRKTVAKARDFRDDILGVCQWNAGPYNRGTNLNPLPRPSSTSLPRFLANAQQSQSYAATQERRSPPRLLGLSHTCALGCVRHGGGGVVVLSHGVYVEVLVGRKEEFRLAIRYCSSSLSTGSASLATCSSDCCGSLVEGARKGESVPTKW